MATILPIGPFEPLLPLLPPTLDNFLLPGISVTQTNNYYVVTNNITQDIVGTLNISGYNYVLDHTNNIYIINYV